MVTFTQFLIILTILYVAWIYYKQTQFEKDFEALKQLIDVSSKILKEKSLDTPQHNRVKSIEDEK